MGVFAGLSSLYLWGWSLLNVNLPDVDKKENERIQAYGDALLMSWDPNAMIRARQSLKTLGWDVAEERETTITRGKLALHLGFFDLSSTTDATQTLLRAVSVTPSSGAGSSQTFKLMYADPSGASDLASAQVVINKAVNGAGACWVSVDPIHALISLRNDANSAWLGPVALGVSTTLQNSQCSVNAAKSTAVSAGRMLTVNLALSFAQAFHAVKHIYAQAENAEGLMSGWQPLGTWTP
jgi:hypothetical protein